MVIGIPPYWQDNFFVFKGNACYYKNYSLIKVHCIKNGGWIFHLTNPDMKRLEKELKLFDAKHGSSLSQYNNIDKLRHRIVNKVKQYQANKVTLDISGDVDILNTEQPFDCTIDLDEIVKDGTRLLRLYDNVIGYAKHKALEAKKEYNKITIPGLKCMRNNDAIKKWVSNNHEYLYNCAQNSHEDICHIYWYYGHCPDKECPYLHPAICEKGLGCKEKRIFQCSFIHPPFASLVS